MAFGTKYIIAFTNNVRELIEIYFEYPGFSGPAAQIEGTDDCLNIKSVMNDDDKLASIIGTEAIIKMNIKPDTGIDIFDFIADTDNAIRVTVYRNQNYNSFIFQGFIAVEDNSEPFQDAPFVIQVRALDGLSLLKGVDFVDNNGYLYNGNFSVVQWLAECLWKTGQTCNLRVYFNIFHSSFSQTKGALEQTFLSSTTFSQGDAFNINQTDPSIDLAALNADDAYTALEKIVRCFRCRLFIEDGFFHLVNLYEYFNPAGMSYVEYSFGSPYTTGLVNVMPVGSSLNNIYAAPIGKKKPIVPWNNDQIIYLKLATKWNQLNYTYNQSLNKICNQDLSDIGPPDRNPSYDEVITSAIIDPNITPVVPIKTIGYNAFCWTHLDGGIFKISPTTAPAKRGFIRSCIDANGYEFLRFLTLDTPSTNDLFTFFQASDILLDQGDVIQPSISCRTRDPYNDQTGGNSYIAMIVQLLGEDGNTYILDNFNVGIDGACKWITKTPSVTEPPALAFANTSIGTQWNSFTWNNVAPFAQAPVNGTLQVFLICMKGSRGDGTEHWFKDLQITINPFLVGGYQQVSGDYNFSGSNNNIKQSLNQAVEISDSPKRYLKGALLAVNAFGVATNVLSPNWARRGITESLRFTQIMGQLIYNNIYRQLSKIEGTFKGLMYWDKNYGEHSNGFLNVFNFEDGNFATKKYIMTSFDKDYCEGTYRAVFVEVNKDANDTGFTAPDKYVFNYIFTNNS